MLNQELNSIKRTQWQKKQTLFFDMENYLEKKMVRSNFLRLKIDLRNKLEYSQYWSDDVWKSNMTGGGGNKKIFQYCIDLSGQEILDLRALQGHSGRNPIHPSLQDNIFPNNFFEYIYPIGCAINLTLHHEFKIDTGRTKFEQKTDGILYVCGSYEQRTQRS